MKPSWLFGIGATRTEKALTYAVAVMGVGYLFLLARVQDWSWWQYVIGGAVTLDLVGGVVANSLRSAKRFYHGPLRLSPTPLNRFLHNTIGFTAVHVQPIIIGLLFGGAWWWGLLWYAWALAGVILVTRMPPASSQPVALSVVVSGLLASFALPDPPAFEWLPAVLLLKLVLAHAVPPGPSRQ